MLRDRQTQLARVRQRLSHHAGIHHRQTVVRKPNHARFFEQAHLGQFFAFLPFGNRSISMHIHKRRFARAFLYEGHHRRIIDHRLGVGHARHMRDTARRRGFTAGSNRFLMFLPRLAEMHLDIKQSRREEMAIAIHNLRVLRQFVFGEMRAKIGDSISNREQSAFFIEPRRGIE